MFHIIAMDLAQEHVSPGNRNFLLILFYVGVGLVKVKVRSLSPVGTLGDPVDCSPPAPPSMGFSRQEYWVAIFFSRGIFPTQESNLGLPHCRQMLNL